MYVLYTVLRLTLFKQCFEPKRSSWIQIEFQVWLRRWNLSHMIWSCSGRLSFVGKSWWITRLRIHNDDNIHQKYMKICKYRVYYIYLYKYTSIYDHTCMYIYPQTGTFADPETHPLRGFDPLCRYRVLAFGRFFLDKVLRNGLLRYILYTCPKLWCNSCSKCYRMDCFGTYFTHVQTCDVTRVQSATKWTASVHTLHMSKPVM